MRAKDFEPLSYWSLQPSAGKIGCDGKRIGLGGGVSRPTERAAFRLLELHVEYGEEWTPEERRIIQAEIAFMQASPASTSDTAAIERKKFIAHYCGMSESIAQHLYEWVVRKSEAMMNAGA